MVNPLPANVIIAHRGASFHAPEETAAAFALARDLGADYLEADIQRTRDGVLVAIHDDTLARTTNVAKVFPERTNDTIETFSLTELKRLDAGTWFNTRFRKRARPGFIGLDILTLAELVDMAEQGKNRPGLYLETKSAERYPGIEKQLVDLLARRGWIAARATTPETDSRAVTVGLGPARVVFQSFVYESLIELRNLAPSAPRTYLVDRDMANRVGVNTLLQRAAAIDAHIGPHGVLATSKNVREAHQLGLRVHPWTIDLRTMFAVLARNGADGFFTNRTDKLLKFYGRKISGSIDSHLSSAGY
jgi:glycerophosphoryl diester phosphodiesterase